MLSYRALEEWSILDNDKNTGTKNGVTTRLLCVFIAICNLKISELSTEGPDGAYENINRKINQLFGWKFMNTASLSRNMNYLANGVERSWDKSYDHPKGTGAKFNLIRLIPGEHDKRSRTIEFTPSGTRLRRIFLGHYGI